jgi:MoaA/NifB/PqqE/SkfB family radical SAM enzyme
MASHVPTHSNINQKIPEQLNITLGSTCNLTCSYCCKQYSTAWNKDIKNNGAYLDSDRFRLLPIDSILSKISQKEQENSHEFLMLLNQIKLLDSPKIVDITGGEPFLYNNLSVLIDNFSDQVEILLHTGLGVNHSRFKNQINKIKHRSNLKIIVSAENVYNFYEFNRYGNTYQNFESNLELLINSGLTPSFLSIISNLTVFGLEEFATKYQHLDITYDYCHDPDYLSVHVLDDISKEKLTQSLESSDISIKNEIIQSLWIDCTQEQQKNCSLFVKEFASRRNLDLEIFPKSMLQWLNHVV